MLALATTTATVLGRPPVTEDTPRARDAHGSPLPQPETPRGPYDGHRGPFTARVRGASRALAAVPSEVHLQTWYLEPGAWPVHKGDVIRDERDGSRWTVQAADLVPQGLGLDQVMAACSQLDTSAS
jgi:hypothetical protein